MNKSIQFILDQLATDEASRERFNEITQYIRAETLKTGELVFLVLHKKYYDSIFTDRFENLQSAEQQFIIRTCLSRIDGKAVLSALEGELQPLNEPSKESIFEEYKDILKFQGVFAPDQVSDEFLKNTVKNYRKIFGRHLLSELLYESFDAPLRNGESLESALTALDQKMADLGLIEL